MCRQQNRQDQYRGLLCATPFAIPLLSIYHFPTHEEIDGLLWTIAEPSTSLFYACLSVLRPFFPSLPDRTRFIEQILQDLEQDGEVVAIEQYQG